MEALILSCSTGGGHNVAGNALKQEMEKRGHHVVMMDPYELVSDRLADEIGKAYVKTVQISPKMFGFIYVLGNIVRKVPMQSPVYYANIAVAKKLGEYLNENHVDVILCTHLFPAELITYLKKNREDVPPSVYVATDYVCIPFTEETSCDYYVIPGKSQAADFIKRGIPEEKLLPLGIPVNEAFETELSRAEARKKLGLEPYRTYVLLAGGSIGIGNIEKTVDTILPYFDERLIYGQMIIITGNNEKLYSKLERKYGGKIILIKHTDEMAAYMKACDVFISKPGGLSSTEAAVSGTPCIHMPPIPGCESYNYRYFKKCGMSLPANKQTWTMKRALKKLSVEKNVEKMKKKQSENIPHNARLRICEFVEHLVAGNY